MLSLAFFQFSKIVSDEIFHQRLTLASLLIQLLRILYLLLNLLLPLLLPIFAYLALLFLFFLDPIKLLVE